MCRYCHLSDVTNTVNAADVPSSDASRTLWWTTEHDYRLMQLVCKYGWGSWKQICDDESELNVTNVPKGFVVPAREPTGENISGM